MVIQCPHCRTLNKRHDSLASPSETVHCDHCQAVIQIPGTLRRVFPEYTTPVATESSIFDQAPSNVDSESITPPKPDLEELYALDQAYSKLARPSQWWTVGILGLLLTFILQNAYFLRDDLSRHEILRPWLEKLCMVAGCEIPLLRDVSKVIIVNREVQNIADKQHILQVRATLKNIAPYTQPFPFIMLTFYDIDGHKIAYRRFKPEEYLSQQIDTEKGMKPQIPVIAELQILDPGENAITYQFDFL
jgi:hypothetical protein